MNPLRYFIGNQEKKESGCGLWGKIWAKLGPMLRKSKEIGISIGVFSYFVWGMHLKARSSGFRKYLSGNWRPN